MDSIKSDIFGYSTAPNPSSPEINVVITEPSNVKDSIDNKILSALLRIEDYLKSIDRTLDNIEYYMKKG